jgi:hypothetical protein
VGFIYFTKHLSAFDKQGEEGIGLVDLYNEREDAYSQYIRFTSRTVFFFYLSNNFMDNYTFSSTKMNFPGFRLSISLMNMQKMNVTSYHKQFILHKFD